MILPPDKVKRDVAYWLVIGAGGFVIALIIIGFVYTVRPFLREDALVVNTTCGECLTAKDNGKAFSFPQGTQIILSLPKNLYSQTDIVVIADPEEALQVRSTDASGVEWRVFLYGAKKGKAEVSVKSIDPTVSDYHIILEVT